MDSLPEAISTGIYYGWASVDRGPVYKMVMSVGWNPFYKNTKKSMVRKYFVIFCKFVDNVKMIKFHRES